MEIKIGLKTALVGAFLLGCATTQLIDWKIPKAHAGVKNLYEYRCQGIKAGTDINKPLNEFGKQGWEAFHIQDYGTKGSLICFKRPGKI